MFANGLRVSLIGIWTLYYPSDTIHGPFSILYVSFIVVFGLGLLIAASLLTKGRRHKKASAQTANPIENIKISSFFQVQPLSIIVALTVLFIMLGYPYLLKAKPIDLKMPLKSFPTVIDRWKGHDVDEKDWPFRGVAADVELKRIYHDSSQYEIGLYIGYFFSQSEDKEIVTDSLKWLYNRAEDQPVNVDSKTVHIKKGLPRGLPDQTYQGDNRSFYFWYEIDFEILTGRYTTKLVTLLNSLLKRRSNGAMIVVTVNDKWHQNKEANDHAVKFIQTAFPFIQEYLKTVQ
jgi:EpsI family protein